MNQKGDAISYHNSKLVEQGEVDRDRWQSDPRLREQVPCRNANTGEIYWVDRRTRYRYGDILDRPPVFMWVDKDNLIIDEQYQREQNLVNRPGSESGHPAHIAKYWRWQAFTALVVGRREDGTMAVIDGGNRLRAARMRSDIKDLPCLVYDTDAVSEANTFDDINTARTAPNTFDRLKNDEFRGVEYAILVRDVLSENGFKFAPPSTGSTDSFSPLAALCVVCKKAPHEARMIMRAAKKICGKNITRTILLGLFEISKQNQGVDISDEFYIRPLRKVGIDEIDAEINRRAIKANATRNGALAAHVLVGIMNKQKRTNRLNYE